MNCVNCNVSREQCDRSRRNQRKCCPDCSHVPLCKDCAFCRADIFGLKCGHPKVALKDFATGEHQYADLVRRFDSICGARALLFEPKPPVPPSWWVRALHSFNEWLQK